MLDFPRQVLSAAEPDSFFLVRGERMREQPRSVVEAPSVL